MWEKTNWLIKTERYKNFDSKINNKKTNLEVLKMEKPKHHIFVCTSSRLTGENKGFCVQQKGKEIIQAFVEALQDRDLESEILVTNTGCLGLCTMGSIVIIYPDQIWYGKVTVEDVEEIVDALEAGSIVERLSL